MVTEILMPALSPTMEEGKLAKWLVKEGDDVHSGDILAEIETDKATMEFEAADDGKIGKILVPEGTEGVKVNQPIATILREDENADHSVDISTAMQSIKNAVTAEAAPSDHPFASEGEEEAKAASQPEEIPHTDQRIVASPLARRLAADVGVDVAAVQGSGPGGRIVKADIEAAGHTGFAAKPEQRFLSSANGKPGFPGVAPLPAARLFYRPDAYAEVPHDTMRKAIARRLVSAAALVPHFYLTIDCRIDRLLAARARLNAQSPEGEGAYKLSVNDFVVKACAAALIRVPKVNASWADDAMLYHKHADIGVAVALDFGLVAPIVFGAETKGLMAISNEIKSLAERARAKKLKPREYEGGSFAVSNLGMFGIKEFTAVINPPHAAILAVGAGEERVVARDGKIETAHMMTVTLSCDHRAIDGATGARFLQAFRSFIEDPAAMLL